MGKANWYHFIGIGGIGMSALAQILTESGFKVTGSDLKESDITKKLEKCGVGISKGHCRLHIKEGMETVVISTAIPESNVEVKEARERGINVIKRAELLGSLMESRKGIAVTGAHGKTTTSSMIALIMEKAGLSPTIALGGELDDIGGNGKKGNGEYLVAEADESDGSFVFLSPEVAVITNIEDDHLDYYGNMELFKKAYKDFLVKVSPSGKAVLCFDDPLVREMGLSEYDGEYISYGIFSKADYTARNIIVDGSGSSADVYYKDEKLGQLKLQVPGNHNISNALAAIATCHSLGIDFKSIAKILGGFQGAKRRFQLIGEKDKIRIIDDYAHHPTEIDATLKAARETHNGRIIAIFQPHRYSRTKQLYKEFGKSFTHADQVIITSIYSAGEEPMEGVSAKKIADVAKDCSPDKPVIYISEQGIIVNYLNRNTRSGDMVITLGAGDIWQVGVLFAQKLGA